MTRLHGSAISLIVTGLVIAAAAQVRDTAAAFAEMAAAERAFARTALEKGIRDAFVEFFADDSIGFFPDPVNGREFFRNRPPSPLSRRLEWEPRTGDVARSGELGWLTGPSTLRDTAAATPPAYGCYFSIWRKQAGGSWKVLIDVGTDQKQSIPCADRFAQVAESDRYLLPAGSPPPTLAEIVAVDRELSAAIKADTRRGYERVLTPVTRVHIPEVEPLIGSQAILARLTAETGTYSFEPETGGVARSGDLAFTRGRYTRGTAEKGYYVRTWKRQAKGNWMLAVEVRVPVPA